MKTEKGKFRRAFLFPRFGIVVKIPIIRWGMTYRMIRHFIRGREFGNLWIHLTGSINASHSVLFLLCKGIACNWNEFAFYATTWHPLLQPTYFSLFGIVNVQLYGVTYKRHPKGRWNIIDQATNGDARADLHHFDDGENFCRSRGAIRIVDYGDWATQKIIREHGTRLFRALNK